MGQILTSLEVEVALLAFSTMITIEGHHEYKFAFRVGLQPGYGALVNDFHISKTMVHSPEEKIVRNL